MAAGSIELSGTKNSTQVPWSSRRSLGVFCAAFAISGNEVLAYIEVGSTQAGPIVSSFSPTKIIAPPLCFGTSFRSMRTGGL